MNEDEVQVFPDFPVRVRFFTTHDICFEADEVAEALVEYAADGPQALHNALIRKAIDYTAEHFASIEVEQFVQVLMLRDEGYAVEGEYTVVANEEEEATE